MARQELVPAPPPPATFSALGTSQKCCKAVPNVPHSGTSPQSQMPSEEILGPLPIPELSVPPMYTTLLPVTLDIESS